jgi:hypothetical protein
VVYRRRLLLVLRQEAFGNQQGRAVGTIAARRRRRGSARLTRDLCRTGSPGVR